MSDKEFRYAYTAPTEAERREIAAIRREYTSGEDLPPLERLRLLDGRVKTTPTVLALVLGVVGLLVFGLGLTMVLEWGMPLLGILVMVVGAVPIGLAYPVYLRLLAAGKRKYGAEILRLSDLLLGNEEN